MANKEKVETPEVTEEDIMGMDLSGIKLPEDYAGTDLEVVRKGMGAKAFTDFLDRINKMNLKETQAKARDMANEMCTKGKYSKDYNVLEGQLNAIWKKALNEAHANFGLDPVED